MLLSERITLLPGAIVDGVLRGGSRHYHVPLDRQVIGAEGGNLQSPQQPVGVGREQLFHGHGPGDNVLLNEVLD